MASRGLSDLPLRRVERMTRPPGRKNYVLTLSCGHKKLHTPGKAVPYRAHCAECAR